MTDVEIPEGWIAHDGGPCPVPLRSRPQVMFRDGTIRDRPGVADTASRYIGVWDNWRWLGPPHTQIIAYKPAPRR